MGNYDSEALRFLESRIDWIIAARQRVAERGVVTPYERSEIEALRQKAKSYLPQRCAQIALQFGFRYNRLTIRATRSKWGSCSAENNISLSLFLMTLPPQLIDFVIIHELCHTIHHNHSPRFHDLVDKCTNGNEKMLHKALRSYNCGGNVVEVNTAQR